MQARQNYKSVALINEMFPRNKLLAFFMLIIVIFTFCSYMFMQQMYVRRLLLVLCSHRLRLVQAAVLACEHERRRLSRRRNRRAPYFWVLPRPQVSWFDIHYNDRRIPEENFRQQLRLGRETFDRLLDMLSPRLMRRNTVFRNCLPPEKVLAIGLYRLAHGNSYVTIGPSFNVGKSTVIEAVEDVVDALFDIREEYIYFPITEEEVWATNQTFEDLTLLPNVVGAIDGTHIKIKTPTDSAADYFSRLQRHDVIVQAVADGNKRFLDLAAGFPGAMHDSLVLRRSKIGNQLEDGELLKGPVETIAGRRIKPFLFGDSAYPLITWLMKPYPEATNDPREIKFNKELSSARVSVECAFGVLKGRWRILQKRLDSDISFTNRIIMACAVLHNFCINSGDIWDEECTSEGNDPTADRETHEDGDDLREFLKNYIYGL